MKPKCWVAGISAGVVTGAVGAAMATFRDWRINPSGLYHGADGTNWHIVCDTAMSWFVPVAGYVTLVVLIVLFVYSRWR